MYGSPKALVRRARELDDRVEDLRETARSMRTRATHTAWVGLAVEAHRRSVEDAARSLERVADRLADAADALRAYAHEVVNTLALIDAAQAVARHWFHAAQNWLSAGAHAVVDGVQHLFGGGRTPPWHGWGWTPATLPELGHVDWLDVVAHVNASGWRP